MCVRIYHSVLFFFFKQKTAYEIVDCDWSSDVCSSDLSAVGEHTFLETMDKLVQQIAENEDKMVVLETHFDE